MTGASHISVFGFTLHSNLGSTTTAFAFIVLYIILAERSLDALDQKFEGSYFREMIQCLYKELVIMGMSSFIITMFINSAKESKLLTDVIYLVYLTII